MDQPPLPAIAPSNVKSYYVSTGENRLGPFTESEIRQQIAQGTLSLTNLVYNENSEQWFPIGGLFPQQGASALPHPQAQIRLWNPTAAVNWSVLFSPVFGQILHYLNWKALGNTRMQRVTVGWIALSLIAMPTLALVFSGIGFWAQLGVLAAWYVISGIYQCRTVENTVGKNYMKRSWWLPLGVAIAAWIVVYGVLVTLMLAQAGVQNMAVDTQPAHQEPAARPPETSDTTSAQINSADAQHQHLRFLINANLTSKKARLTSRSLQP